MAIFSRMFTSWTETASQARSKTSVHIPVPLHMQEPFTLLNEPKAGQELGRALTAVQKGRELALGQMRMIANLMDLEKAQHEARMSELAERHAKIRRELDKASGHQLAQAPVEVLGPDEYMSAVARATLVTTTRAMQARPVQENPSPTPSTPAEAQASARERMVLQGEAMAKASDTKPATKAS